MNEHPVNEPYKPNARETRIQIIKFALFSASAGTDGKSRLEQLRRPFSHHSHEPYF